MTHKEEICRWANNPDRTEVWFKVEGENKWGKTSYPNWCEDVIYITDDRHAELRKKWFDEGKPQVQILGTDPDDGWIDVKNDELKWSVTREYRIKPKNWYENIPPQGILCWVWDSSEQTAHPCIVFARDPNSMFPYRSKGINFRNARPMTIKEAKQFIYEGETK